MTKDKLGQFVPYGGAIVGGGFNAYFTNKVCDAAYFLYRERFLATKYGPDILSGPTSPADDHDPRYPEGAEELPPDRTPPDGAHVNHRVHDGVPLRPSSPMIALSRVVRTPLSEEALLFE